MTRDNLLFAIIGILIGFIIGFLLANSILTREAALRAAPLSAAQQSGNLPPNHPPVAGGDQQGGDGQQIFTQVQEAMKQAREQPENFEAQLTAAELEYKIQRYDQAIEYLLIANKLKPADQSVLFNLAVTNLDAGHYDAAEKWYKVALLKKPNDIPLVDGYCFALLGKGDAKGAEEVMNKLEKLDPTNQDLPQIKEKLAELKSGKK